MSNFIQFIKDHKLLQAVTDLGYEKPTPIQISAIPLVRRGYDMIARSNTGTGKTAAFALPMIEMLNLGLHQRLLIVCPTRELALQVEEEIKKYTKYLAIKTICVYGGEPIDTQIKKLKQGWDIVVGTPGRILDHSRRKSMILNDCDAIVLDEADEMLNMGFVEDVERILSQLKEEHQTLLFSATMPKEIRALAAKYLKDYHEVEIKSSTKTVDSVEQYAYEVKRDKKNEAVKLLLDYFPSKLCIVFCNTKAKVDALVDSLKRSGIMAEGLHGDIRQEKRTRIMRQFKQSEKAVLVASDVAARGIDVNDIDLVINYDLPQEKEIYIHRIGRTGRAGKKGKAVTLLCGKKQKQSFYGLQKYMKVKVVVNALPEAAEVMRMRKEKLKAEIMNYAKDGIQQEHLQFANELIKEGLCAEKLVSALVAAAFGGNIPSLKKRSLKKEEVELRFSVGRNKNISRRDIANAIIGCCEMNQEKLGKIDVRAHYSIVSVDRYYADHIIDRMHRTKIKNKRCEVNYYQKEKNKKPMA